MWCCLRWSCLLQWIIYVVLPSLILSIAVDYLCGVAFADPVYSILDWITCKQFLWGGGGLFIFLLFKSFCFLFIEFHCTFSMSYWILPYYVYYYYFIFSSTDRPSVLFFDARFTSLDTHASLLTFFCFFVLFHSCSSHARVLGKHSCMSSPFPMTIRSGTSFFHETSLPNNNGRRVVCPILMVEESSGKY